MARSEEVSSQKRHQRAKRRGHDPQCANIQDIDPENHAQRVAQAEAQPCRKQKQSQPADVATDDEVKAGAV